LFGPGSQFGFENLRMANSKFENGINYRSQMLIYSHTRESLMAIIRLILYQYQACPFCVKVRRTMKRQGLKIEIRAMKRNDAAREELLAGGGDLKVPCLRIREGERGDQWMYESSEIINYLEARFTASSAVAAA
jgi:glutaredoxin